MILVNDVTRSQSKLMIKDDSDSAAIKAKGKQIAKDELAKQHQVVAKLIEVFAKMRPEKLESSSAREITKVQPKPLNNPMKASQLGTYKYVQKQNQTGIQKNQQVIEVDHSPARDSNDEVRKNVAQEQEGMKEAVNEQLKEQEGLKSKPIKKFKFAKKIATIHEAKQWILVKSKASCNETEKATNNHEI